MKKIFYILTFASIALCACEKQMGTSPREIDDTGQKVYPEIKAVIAETKTIITDNGSTFSFAFQEDDDIAVFNGVKDAETHLPCRYRCTRIEGGVAYFSYNPTTDAERAIEPDTELATIVATHPYRGTTTSGYETYGSGTLKVRMANSLSSSSSGYVKASVPIVAAAAAGDVLQFKHTIGLMQLKLKGTDINIKQIVVVSDKKIVGDSGLEYGDSEPVLEVKGTDGYGLISDFYKATYKYNDATGLALSSEGMDFYIALPEGSHNLSLTITDADGNSMLLSAPSVPISRGVVIPTELNYVADPLSNVTNLSAFGHFANCYVVTSAGNYCFNARKPDGTLVSGSSAAWVWASGEACSSATDLPSTMMSAISLSNGKVYFTVPSSFKVGNVVLGVLDGSSNLLYTWHVWLTSEDMDDIISNGITLMDRNLGAGAIYDVSIGTNAPLQNGKGCFYQWGRKDPILGARNSIQGAESTMYGTTNSQYTVVNSTAGIVNVSAWGIEAFTSFSVEAGAAKPVTMGNGPAAKPGYEEGNTDAWSERTNANPCPYGYRPISSTEFTTLHDAGYSTENYNNFGQITLGGVKFARAGYRGGTDGCAKEGQSKSGSSGTARYWTNNASSATQGVLAKVTWATSQTDGVYPLSSSWWSLAGFNANHACNVRCVKDI